MGTLLAQQSFVCCNHAIPANFSAAVKTVHAYIRAFVVNKEAHLDFSGVCNSILAKHPVKEIFATFKSFGAVLKSTGLTRRGPLFPCLGCSRALFGLRSRQNQFDRFQFVGGEIYFQGTEFFTGI